MTALTLRGGMVWDGRADALREASVVVDEGKIAAIGTGAASGTALDISGCTALPGLIEGHAHLCFNAASNWRAVFDSDTPGRMLLRMVAHGRTMLEAGITTVRDLGAPTGLAIEIREAFASGLAPGPDLLVSGAPITTTGGHCWFMGGEADGELELRKAVRGLVKAGVDWIKVMATGGSMTRGTNTLAAQYSTGELRAIVEEAHRLGRRVAAHCHGTAGIRAAVEAGVDSLEHCSFAGPDGVDRDDALIDRIAASNTIVSQTISVGYRRWLDDGQRRQRSELLQRILKTGCRMIASTDCGIPNVGHAELAGGLEVFSELGGLSPVQVLRLATSASGELLGMADRGALEPGRRADVLVVSGDPTANLGALTRVRYVIKGGQVVYAAP
ncbi:amidohydrolase family protein [bacterium]|nr:MAG: amidohydrolase family protein [bacterium]MCL4229982.1 amidohydrolase family protein [Dehalococcoidia bacterium]